MKNFLKTRLSYRLMPPLPEGLHLQRTVHPYPLKLMKYSVPLLRLHWKSRLQCCYSRLMILPEEEYFPCNIRHTLLRRQLHRTRLPNLPVLQAFLQNRLCFYPSFSSAFHSADSYCPARRLPADRLYPAGMYCSADNRKCYCFPVQTEYFLRCICILNFLPVLFPLYFHRRNEFVLLSLGQISVLGYTGYFRRYTYRFLLSVVSFVLR